MTTSISISRHYIDALIDAGFRVHPIHRGPRRQLGDISIRGQESNYTTWRLAKMNLAIRGIDAQIGRGDTFHNDRHPDLKADYVRANLAAPIETSNR